MHPPRHRASLEVQQTSTTSSVDSSSPALPYRSSFESSRIHSHIYLPSSRRQSLLEQIVGAVRPRSAIVLAESDDGSDEKWNQEKGSDGKAAAYPVELDVEDTVEVDHALAAQRKKRRRRWMTICGAIFSVLLLGGIIWAAVVESLWKKYLSSPIAATSISDQHIMYRNNDMWSVNVTALQGVKRIAGHSHNDEMQQHPLSTALSQGFGSIEADVWLVDSSSQPSLPDEVLWVGHETKDLSTNQTLYNIYLRPLMELLDINNAHLLQTTVNGTNIIPTNASVPTTGWTGVYPSDPAQTMQLVIDFKNSPFAAYERLQYSLRRLKARGYLTTYNTTSKEWSYGPITVIGTGDTPLEAVYYAGQNASNPLETPNQRYIFYDAPLLSLHKPFSIPASAYGPSAETIEWTRDIAPMASSKFPVPWNAAALIPPPPSNVILPQLKGYAEIAQAKGIQCRWWGAARSPGWVRHRLWALQLDAGNVWLNADDLADARLAIERHR